MEAFWLVSGIDTTQWLETYKPHKVTIPVSLSMEALHAAFPKDAGTVGKQFKNESESLSPFSNLVFNKCLSLFSYTNKQSLVATSESQFTD